jgi:hypothetical protein
MEGNAGKEKTEAKKKQVGQSLRTNCILFAAYCLLLNAGVGKYLEHCYQPFLIQYIL